MKIEPNSMNVRCVTDFRPSAMNEYMCYLEFQRSFLKLSERQRENNI